MPNYTVPHFNLSANLWLCDGAVKPSAGEPDVEDFPTQKYISSRTMVPLTLPTAEGFFVQRNPMILLRFPRLGEFSGPWQGWKVTCCEVPAGSGQYYRTYHQEVQHEGFPNEYAQLAVVQCDADLKAITPAGGAEPVGQALDACGGGPPPTDSFLDTFDDVDGTLLEDHIANTGESWTINETPTLKIDGTVGAVYDDDTTGLEVYAVANYVGGDDGDIQLDFRTPADVTNGFWIGVVFRAIDTSTFMLLTVDWLGGTDWVMQLSSVASGIPTLIDTSSSFTFSNSTDYALGINISGSSLGFILEDGVSTILTWSATSSVLTGETGLGVWYYRDSLNGVVAGLTLQKSSL